MPYVLFGAPANDTLRTVTLVELPVTASSVDSDAVLSIFVVPSSSPISVMVPVAIATASWNVPERRMTGRPVEMAAAIEPHAVAAGRQSPRAVAVAYATMLASSQAP